MGTNRALLKAIFVSYFIFWTDLQKYNTVFAQIYDVDNLRTMCRSDCQDLLLALTSFGETFSTCDWNCKKHECKNGCDHWNSDADMSFTCLSYCSTKNYTCSSGCRDMESRKLTYIRGIVKTALVKKSQVTFNGIEISWELINPDIVGVTWKVELRNVETKNISWTFAHANLGYTGNLFTISIPSNQMNPLTVYQIRLVAFYKNRKVDVSESSYIKTMASDLAPSTPPSISEQMFIKPFNNFLICWKEPVPRSSSIMHYNLKLDDDKNALSFNESTNSTCFMFSQLSPNTNYKISITAVNDIGSSPAVTVSITTPDTNISEPILYFTNKSHIMTLDNVYDFLGTPKTLFTISKPEEELTAVRVLSDMIFAATTTQFIKIEPYFNKPQTFQLPVINVKIILADNLNQKIYLFNDNKIFLCDFPDWLCEPFLTAKYPVFSAVLDIITGFVYYSTKEGLFRFALGNQSTLEKMDILPNQQCHLALNSVKSHLICNYNDKVVEYNLITSKIDTIKSDLLRLGSQRRYDNVIRMVSWKENLIWISNPCKEPSSENSCLFTDEKDIASGFYSIQNYLIPPGHGTLVDLDIGFDQLSPILLPPSNLSAFFSADTIRLVWNNPVPLRFQARDFLSSYNFQLELSSEMRIVKTINVTNDYQYLFNHGSLESKKKFTIKIKACYRSTCSKTIETSGRTFNTDLSLKDTKILTVTSRGALTFTILGANVSQLESFNGNEGPLLVARKSSSTGLILSSNGFVYIYDTIEERLVPTKTKLFNITSMDFEPIGDQLYFSDFTGIYRTILNSDEKEKVFPETNAKFLNVLSTNGLIIVGTSSSVYSLFLTGVYNFEHFVCPYSDCEVLAVTACDKGTIYYIYRQNQILTLETSSFDGSNKKQISANFDNFPLNIKSFSCLSDKFVIGTDDGRIGIFDPDDGHTNFLQLIYGQDFCILQKETTLQEIQLPRVTGVDFSSDKNGDEILKWTIDTSSKPSTVSTFYKVEIFNPKIDDGYIVSETVTDQTFIYIAGLNLTEINVKINVFNQWQTNSTSFNVRPPVSIPSKCKNPRIYSSKVKSLYNISSTVIFVWDPPFWNGFPKGYKIFCWSFTGTTRSPYYANGTEIDPNFPMYLIENLPIGVTVYCQVSAGNVEKGYGMLSTPVNISTNDDNSGSLVLISGPKYFGLYDTNKHDFVGRSFNSSAIYKSIGYISKRLYMIEQSQDSSDIGWAAKSGKASWSLGNKLLRDGSTGTGKNLTFNRILTNDINTFNQLIEVPINLPNVQLRALTADWVGNNLFIAGSESNDQTSSIWSYSVQSNNNAHKIYDGLPGGTIENMVFDPLNSFLYFTQFTGVKYKIYQMDIKIYTTKALKCDIVSNALAAKSFDATSNKISVFAISGEGLIDIEDCQVLFPSINFNVRMESVLSMAMDTKKVYLNTAAELVVYDITSKTSQQFDVSSVDLEAFCPSCQAFPDSACLVLPPNSQNLSARPVEESSVEIVISDPIWPLECARVSRPSIFHTVTIKPTAEKDCINNPKCFEKKTLNSSILFTDLTPNNEYEATIFGFNAFNTKTLLTEPLKFQLSLGLESSPQQLQSFALTPNKILLVWMPPKSSLSSMGATKYAVSQIGNAFQSIGALNFTITCLKSPCQEKINGSFLKPSTNYTFSIFAKTDKQSLDDAMKSRSSLSSVKTFDLPGTLIEQQPNKSSNSLTFIWLKKDKTNLKSTKFSYQKVNEIKWREFPQGFQQSNGGILYTLDKLDPDTQYSIKYVAEYESKYNYNGNELTFPSESFQVVTTSVTLTVNREPDAPINLQIATLNNEKYLNWTKPFDGGKDISMYKIEYKLDENSNWTETEFGRYVSGYLQSAIKIPESFHTTPTTQFRVMARNVNGWSLPAVVSLKSSELVDGSKSKSNAVGIVIGVAIACLITLIIITVFFAIRRRKKSKQPPLITSADPAAIYPIRTESDNLQTVKQISPEDINSLPHVPRSCITISKLLGSGAFGEVFEGLAYNLQRTGNNKTVRVAVKTLRPGSSENDRVKFLKEAVLMKNLVHPNVVRLLGVCIESEPHWIVLELMEGGSLLQYLRSVRPSDTMPSQVSLKDLVNIALDVAKGCRYLEQIRHVHRDLASRNCLISSRDPQLRQVKIADFGLARDVDDGDYYRVQGHGLLPVRWMAPESLLDGLFTVKSDVWSYGVLLWEIMTLGKQPYSGKTNMDVINFVRLGGRLEKPECCLDEIYQIMIFCWAFDPPARPSFVEIVDKLETLKILDAFVNDSPFPPFYLNSRPSSQAIQDNSQSRVQSNSDGQVQLFATRSSARFSRKHPETQSSRTNGKGKGFGFLSLRKNKDRPPPPPLPTKEQILNSPRTSDHTFQPQLRPDSGSLSGASYTTSTSGYEVPLLKNLKSNARIYDVGAHNPAYQSLPAERYSPDPTESLYNHPPHSLNEPRQQKKLTSSNIPMTKITRGSSYENM